MNESDAGRAQSEALRRAGQETGNERRATRLDQAMQRYLAGAYYAILARGGNRRNGKNGESRKP